MRTAVAEIRPGGAHVGPGMVDVIVEALWDAGTRYELNHDSHQFHLDRMLFSAVHYPGDYGFIPGSLARRRPLDALGNTWGIVPAHLLDEIAHFFAIYKDFEVKSVTVHGWKDRDAALEVIDDSLKRFGEGLNELWPPGGNQPGATRRGGCTTT